MSQDGQESDTRPCGIVHDIGAPCGFCQEREWKRNSTEPARREPHPPPREIAVAKLRYRKRQDDGVGGFTIPVHGLRRVRPQERITPLQAKGASDKANGANGAKHRNRGRSVQLRPPICRGGRS